jgi:hypothetical protein
VISPLRTRSSALVNGTVSTLSCSVSSGAAGPARRSVALHELAPAAGRQARFLAQLALRREHGIDLER